MLSLLKRAQLSKHAVNYQLPFPFTQPLHYPFLSSNASKIQFACTTVHLFA